MRRAVFFTCFLHLVGSSVLAARQSETGVKARPWAKFLGSWRDVPGPDDPSELWIEPESDSMKFSFNCKKNGSCSDVIIGRYDGKPNKDNGNEHPDSAFGASASYICRFPDDRTYEQTSKRNGRAVSTTNRKISEDGQKMVGTSRNAEGKITFDLTYEKID